MSDGFDSEMSEMSESNVGELELSAVRASRGTLVTATNYMKTKSSTSLIRQLIGIRNEIVGSTAL